MPRFLVKTLVSALIIAAASELTRRSRWAAAVLLSLPLTSILAAVWVYHDGGAEAAASLTRGVFWMVLPSLLFFLVLPALIKRGLGFYPALLLSAAAMAFAYAAYAALMGRLGVEI